MLLHAKRLAALELKRDYYILPAKNCLRFEQNNQYFYASITQEGDVTWRDQTFEKVNGFTYAAIMSLEGKSDSNNSTDFKVDIWDKVFYKVNFRVCRSISLSSPSLSTLVVLLVLLDSLL